MSRLFECVHPGSGRPIILLPGLQGDGEIFRPLIPHLPPERPVWKAGFSGLGIPADIERLKAEVQTYQLQGADLVCGSYGGQVGLALEGEVRSVVLTASFPYYSSLGWRARLSLGLSCMLPDSVLGALYGRSLGPRLLKDGVDGQTASSVSIPSGATIKERLRSLRGRKLGAQIRMPILWVMGRSDRSVTWTDAELRTAWPELQIRRVPGKHRPYASHPTDFAAAVLDWWATMGNL